jgi:hypothetical protein
MIPPIESGEAATSWSDGCAPMLSFGLFTLRAVLKSRESAVRNGLFNG